MEGERAARQGRKLATQHAEARKPATQHAALFTHRPRATGAVPRRREDGQLPGAATGQLRRGAIKAAGAGTSNSPRLAQNDCYCALETRAQNDFYY